MKPIVVINGTGGSGKDTFVHECEKFTHVYNYSSVDCIKAVASNLGWRGDKSDEGRKFLSDLKRLSAQYNDWPYRRTRMNAGYFLYTNETDKIMFVHIREPEEIQRFVDEFSAVTLLITNSKVEPIETNLSDGRVGCYKYDYVIDNSGSLEDLNKKAHRFLQDVGVVRGET